MVSNANLISVLVQLLIAGIVVYAIYLFLGMLALPQPIKTLVVLVVAVIGLLWLAGLFGVR